MGKIAQLEILYQQLLRTQVKKQQELKQNIKSWDTTTWGIMVKPQSHCGDLWSQLAKVKSVKILGMTFDTCRCHLNGPGRFCMYPGAFSSVRDGFDITHISFMLTRKVVMYCIVLVMVLQQ